MVEQPEREGRGNLVRQIRGHHVEPGPVDPEGIPLDHVDLRQAPPEVRGEPTVGLDRDDPLRPFREKSCQDSESGSNLQDDVARADPGIGDLPRRHARVDQEMLAERPARSDAELREGLPRVVVHGADRPLRGP